MCFLYPQVYDDGCEVVKFTTTTSSSSSLSSTSTPASPGGTGNFICVPCAQHAATHRRTREPCGLGKVVVSACGPCPRHHQTQDHHHQGEDREEGCAPEEQFADSMTLFDARRDAEGDGASVWDVQGEDDSSSSSSGASMMSPKVVGQEGQVGWGQWARTSFGSWRSSRSGEA